MERLSLRLLRPLVSESSGVSPPVPFSPIPALAVLTAPQWPSPEPHCVLCVGAQGGYCGLAWSSEVAGSCDRAGAETKGPSGWRCLCTGASLILGDRCSYWTHLTERKEKAREAVWWGLVQLRIRKPQERLSQS